MDKYNVFIYDLLKITAQKKGGLNPPFLHYPKSLLLEVKSIFLGFFSSGMTLSIPM